MDIGKHKETIQVTPIENPVRRETPVVSPEVPAPAKTPGEPVRV